MVSGRADQLPLLAVAGAACWHYYRESDAQEKLKKCNGCLRAYYWSHDCQVQDWKGGHKEHCRVLQQVNRVCARPAEGVKPGEHMDYEQYVQMQVRSPFYAMSVPFVLYPCAVANTLAVSSHAGSFGSHSHREARSDGERHGCFYWTTASVRKLSSKSVRL